MWGNILGWLNWSSSNSPYKLYSGAKIETSPGKLANIMNQYYIKKCLILELPFQLLENSKSCGLENINTYTLKLARKELGPGVTHVVNLSITTAVFPSSLKISKKAPLYKSKGD